MYSGTLYIYDSLPNGVGIYLIFGISEGDYSIHGNGEMHMR